MCDNHGYSATAGYGRLECNVSHLYATSPYFSESPVTYHSEAMSLGTPVLMYTSSSRPSFFEHAGYETKQYSFVNPNTTPSTVATSFLRADRPVTQFVNASAQVQEIVNETFVKLTGETMENVLIHICTAEEMKNVHPAWTPSILGLSINSRGIGPHLIFIKEDFLDSVVLTIGHELGHIMTLPRARKLDEEAKAFAFELAWLDVIREHNIGNLASSMVVHLPAANGLHDAAFGFVAQQIKSGKNALNVYFDIIAGKQTLEDLLV